MTRRKVLTAWLCADQDTEKEECQERYPVLFDGLWRFWHRYDLSIAGPNSQWLISLGRTTFVNTLCGKRVLTGKDADDATNAHLEEGVRIKPITVGQLSQSSVKEQHELTGR